jgi:LPS-assembly lipoprotein
MFQTRKIIYLMLTTIVTLSGCGFHLKQQNALSPQLHALAISPSKPWDSFQALLRRHLETAGASFERHEAHSTIKLSDVALTESVIAFGPDGQVYRARLDYTVHFSVEDSKSKILLPDQTVLIRRDYRINPNSKLSSDAEKEVITQEMRRDAVDQVIQRLTNIL